MFLKRLEVIGFKSFADRISIDFVPGVTAIVGPNGSGKSNITDAIRWVLGEQSAKSLRGAKMEDVIFAGSDSRKPLNFAEVTLILDNSKGLFPLDYTEISVSRRVFRSGESIYLLNGQQCRLKDVTNVFMDSGVGKEAFSIISQGRVDEILNSRPEDRRSIFDEAAGVLKYRLRKQKAEHKLFETADNLDRVLDILKELETRIEPLKLHAKSAELHESLAKEMREVDVSILNFDAKKISVQMKEKMKEADELQSELERLHVSIENREKESEELKKQLVIEDDAFETLQEKFVTASAGIEKWEGRRLLFAEKERNAGRQHERIQAEFLQTEKEQEVLQSKLKDTREMLDNSKASFAELSEEMKGITQILKRSEKETEKQIEDLKSRYIDLLNEEATLRNELKHNRERLDGEKTSVEKINEQKELLEKRLADLIGEKEEKERDLAKSQLDMKEMQATRAQNAKVLKEVEEDLAKKQKLLQQAHNRQHEMQGRMRALESMEADFSGFYSGVKEVLVARKSGKLKGISGAVAELITVESGYVKAVETALGGAMQHIVTASEVDAQQAIRFLKARNAGRATFLPLDVMRSRKIQPSALKTILQHEAYIGTADQLVNTEGLYKVITENLLGNVIVASSLRGASEIAKKMNHRYRIVTTDGDIVNAGGSLTGGGVKGQGSVFTRKAELETLKINVGKMEKTIELATGTIGDTKMTVAEFMEITEQSRKQIEVKQLEIASMESGIRETKIAINSAETEFAAVEIGRRGSETTGTELSNNNKALNSKHEQIKQTLSTVKKEVETLERFTTDWRNEEALLLEKLTDLREKSAVLREQKVHQGVAIKEMEQSLKVTKEKYISLQEEWNYFTGEDEEKELTADEIAEKLVRATAEKTKIEYALAETRNKRLSQSARIEKLESMLRNKRVARDEAGSKHNAIVISLSRLEVGYETITQKLYNEYGLHRDFEAPDPSDVQALREKLIVLKRNLTAIGPVNPNAIAEYEEVSMRYDFLTEQRNDLLEAKSTLQVAMSEMDTEMTARFRTTFDAIQNQFRHVFKVMFGGGDADLILTNPTNLLETGVDIVARPPGKKLQNLSLLSGGERALTAISLLFAIIEVRPVPFCILDEVEAALDEANVIRYSKYLKKFSERTQFIVITHRKGTMEGADVLYGITMQESGVSKLISVKISEVAEEVLS